MSSFPPRHLCIAGGLMIAAGVGSVTEMIAKLIEGGFSLDFGFVGIPIGYGILNGRSSSRKWGLFFAIAGLLLIAGGGGWMAYDHMIGSRRLSSPDIAYTIADLILSEASCLYVLLALKRSGHKEWFAAVKEDSSASKSFASAVAVVAAVLLFSQHATEWWFKQTYEQTYPFRVKITPYNAENGKGLGTISYHIDEISPTVGPKAKFPKANASFLGTQDGVQLEFFGTAAQPFEVTLHSKGFQDKTVTLTGKSEFEIRVAMQPLEQDVGEQPVPRPVSK